VVARHGDPLLVSAGNPGTMTGAGNNTWLIDGAAPTLIDAGVGQSAHVAAIARALQGRSLVRVLVTHGHADHASGIAALKREWPSIEACKMPLHGEAGWRALADGETIAAGDGRLRVLHTPGHAPDHICFWDPDHRVLFAGDMVLADSTVMVPYGRGGSLAEYLASLDRLASLGPERIFPGHGAIIEQPLELIGAYIQHRRHRERQILECLNAGVTDVAAIVSTLYPGLAPGLQEAARLTVEAHLEKLRDEGRVVR
jgi:glyoxylase-like metal-dependent hydrolase (beta-lactamase superfamily II)